MFERYLPLSLVRKIAQYKIGNSWSHKRWNKAFYKGQGAYQNAHFFEAIHYYNIAIAYEAANVRNYIARGAGYQTLDQFKAAKADYLKAIEIDEKEYVAYFNLGVLHVKHDRREEADEFYTKALKIYPGYIDALNNRGFNAIGLEKYTEAIKDLQEAVNLYPEYAFAWNNLGFAHFKIGNIDLAIKHIDHSLTLNAMNAYAYKNKAIVLMSLEKKEEARRLLLKAKEFGYKEKYGDEVDDLLKLLNNKGGDSFEINDHLID